jgi:hypothetical protein
VFHDHGGLPAHAARHWTEAVLAARGPRLLKDMYGRARDDVGCSIVPPENTIETLLALGLTLDFGLVYTRRGLLGVQGGLDGLDAERFGERGHELVQWGDELRGRELALAEWVAMTRHCQCSLCAHERRWRWKVKDRYKVADHIAAARRAWALLEGGEMRPLERDAKREVLAWDWTADRGGPPALIVLSDWLAERGAPMPRDALAGMIANANRRDGYP